MTIRKIAKQKPKKISLTHIMDTYHNNPEACETFFFNAKWPNGFECYKCGCNQYVKLKRGHAYQCKNEECKAHNHLLAGTVFQDSKLSLFKLILGMYLFFINNKGMSCEDLRNYLDVNIKTARLLANKCRALMADSNANHRLNSMFFESDAIYIGGPSKEPGHQGMGTEQQTVLVTLSTDKDGEYPTLHQVTCN